MATVTELKQAVIDYITALLTNDALDSQRLEGVLYEDFLATLNGSTIGLPDLLNLAATVVAEVDWTGLQSYVTPEAALALFNVHMMNLYQGTGGEVLWNDSTTPAGYYSNGAFIALHIAYDPVMLVSVKDTLTAEGATVYDETNGLLLTLTSGVWESISYNLHPNALYYNLADDTFHFTLDDGIRQPFSRQRTRRQFVQLTMPGDEESAVGDLWLRGEPVPYVTGWYGDTAVFADGKLTTADMVYFSISTFTTIQDFGNLTTDLTASQSSCSSGDIGVFFGGTVNNGAAYLDTIDKVVFATPGDATAHGTLTETKSSLASASNTTTAITGAGYNNGLRIDVIESFDLINGGNAAFFGTLSGQRSSPTAVSDGNLVIFAGGYWTGSDLMEVVTIDTPANASFYGNLNTPRYGLAGVSNQKRAVFAGGFDTAITLQVIEYIDFGAIGDASEFGNLTTARYGLASACDGGRGVFGGSSSGSSTLIDTLNLLTPSDAAVLGSLTTGISKATGCSGN